MKFYEDLIKKTIRKNNDDIYTQLLEFLAPEQMGINTSAWNPEKLGLSIQGIGGSGFDISAF